MIEDKDLPELSAYRAYERKVPFSSNQTFAPLVTANINDSFPVHRWYRFKEGFAGHLLRSVVKELTPSIGKSFRLLDPFCGVGTSLVSSQELAADGYTITATGIERNPFAAFVARTKVSWPLISTQLLPTGRRILSSCTRDGGRVPKLSSLADGRCMSLYMSRRIVEIRNAINEVKEPTLRDALLLGLAACIEPVSRVRKDGRALRLVDRTNVSLEPLLLDRWTQIQNDALALQQLNATDRVPLVCEGDGRSEATTALRDEAVDLILTSPPYPNNIDYSEVYKLELWLLGFIKDADEFLDLRKSTFRSHPTASFPKANEAFLTALKGGELKRILAPLLERAATSEEKWRARLLTSYFSDLWCSLHDHYQCLRRGGFEVIVIGNSLHGREGEAYLVPTDLALGAIARNVGFSVKQIIAARSLKRRIQGNHFLRESIVVLRKP